MTLHDRVAAARSRLAAAGLPADTAAFDAEALARIALGWSRAEYLARRSDPSPPGLQPHARLVARRERREPVAQIAGVREFWMRDFEVSRDAHTASGDRSSSSKKRSRIARPRQVKRHRVGLLTARWRGASASWTWGHGSGCLAVTARPRDARGGRARRRYLRARPGGCPAQCRPAGRRRSCALRAHESPRGHCARHRPDRLEPAHVPDGHRQALSSEVRDYEPHEAVLGGPDGFDVIRHLWLRHRSVSHPGGVC